MAKRTKATPGLGTPAAAGVAVGGVTLQPMVTPPPERGEKLIRGGQSSGTPGQIVSAANRWRENYNPIRGLTMRRVVELLELGQRGDFAYLQWCYRKVERAYPTLSALISRCEAPLLGFDWEIKIRQDLPKGATKAMAEGQAESLRSAYEQIDNLKVAIGHLHLAHFRGYAHLQKHRDDKGQVYHLEPLHQWTICRDGLEGNWWWNPDSRSTSAPLQFLGAAYCIGGDRLPLEDFIVAEVARPLDELALVGFVRANLCEKDWDGFIEIYGIPGGVVTMPPNVPQGKEQEYEEAARKVAEGGSGAIPNGAAYEANDSPRGVDPFSPRLKRLDEQLIMAATGGKLTMLSESGSGTLAGGAHKDTFEEIAEGRAERISEQMQAGLDKEVLDREHPREPVLAYWELCGKADLDVDGLVKNVVSLAQVGKKAATDWLEEKTGYQLEDEPEPEPEPDIKPQMGADPPSLGARQVVRNRQGDLGPGGFVEAMGEDAGHVLERLGKILLIQDDAIFAHKLKAFLGQFPQLQQDVLADPAAARALQPMIEQAFLSGLKTKPGTEAAKV